MYLQLCEVVGGTSTDQLCQVVGDTAKTTAAKAGGGVVPVKLEQAAPPSRKPRNYLLYSCFKETKTEKGYEYICEKCPKNVAKPVYKKVWKNKNATILMEHLTRDCAGVDISFRIQLLACK